VAGWPAAAGAGVAGVKRRLAGQAREMGRVMGANAEPRFELQRRVPMARWVFHGPGATHTIAISSQNGRLARSRTTVISRSDKHDVAQDAQLASRISRRSNQNHRFPRRPTRRSDPGLEHLRYCTQPDYRETFAGRSVHPFFISQYPWPPAVTKPFASRPSS
jgi:hypothetical protein